MENSFQRSQSHFISKTLFTMGIGLLITFVIAMGTPIFMGRISPMVMIGAIIGELAVVFYLVKRIQSLSITAARMWFVLYAALNGFTLSIIFTRYSLGTVATVFLLTSAMFFCSGMIGITTKKDLTAMGQFFIMMVIGLILLSLVQMFFHLQGLNFLISCIGIIVFCGLTAYDMQKIKRFHAESYAIAPEVVSKFVIISALTLYLDFINIFVYVLNLLNSD